ncbi:PIR protein CIR protein [Plasmodium vinckei lentum]|uniref:PIR protein CIR protein n=1 Tax=Plasmodium vinckei lentum TaxID=138297 RepID=A0A6V7RZB2_PLAVN|nr:PIR protein CIR protein [Plasmodium vinckei lentum]
MPKKACDLFRDVDELFNDKFVNEGRFNDNYSLYNEYCPQGKNGVKKCNTDYERISAVGGYLFMQLIRSNKVNLNNDNDQYSQYFIMWMSHKLYKIAANNIASLDQSYAENLGKSVGNFNFWNLLKNQRDELKDANITVMNMFYLLLKQICETIGKYQTPGIQGHEYTQEAIQCNIIYDEISKSINHCGSYLKILDHFKTMFDGFIHTANKENIHGDDVLSQLTNFSSIDKNMLKHEFNSSSCNQVHEELIKNPPKQIKKEIKRLKAAINKNAQKQSNSESSTSITSQTQEDTALKNSPSGLDFLAIPSEDDDNSDDDDDLDTLDDTKDDLSIDTDNQNQILDPKQGNSTDVSGNGTQMNDPSTSSKSPSQGETPGDTKKPETMDKQGITPTKIEDPPTPLPIPMKQTQDDNSQQSHQITGSHTSGGASPPSDSGSKDTGNIKEPQENKQGGIGGDKQDSGGGIGDKTNPHSDPNTPSSHPLTSDTNQGNSNGGSVGGTGDTDKGALNTGDGQDNKGGPGDGSNGDQGSQGNPGGEKDSGGGAPGDQAATHSSGGSNGYLSNLWKTHLNPMNYIPSASNIYQSSKDILTNATNKVSNAYNSAMNIAQDTYDKTLNIAKDAYGNAVSTVKNAYTTSTNYINGAVNSITNQFNSFGGFQLSDDQSGSGGSGNSLPTDNKPLKKPQTPKLDPDSPPLPPIPQPQPPSATSPPSQPQSNQPQGPSPPQTPPDPQAPSATSPPSSKSLDPQTSSTPIQQTAPTDGNKAFQIPPSGQGTLPSSGSNSLNTKNENVISVANVKVKETSSIWCIGSNNKCGIMGVSVIVISISIILTIIYKYLSLGRTSKSQRKKNMKKVINSIGRKRPIQIIIKSVGMKKMATPVINPVREKKKSLLNIYKLMQADPVPFINLFFLLIFFVYKRKLNYLEL